MYEATAVETPCGHSITTDGRFVLNLSDALAVRNEPKGGCSTHWSPKSVRSRTSGRT